MTWIGVHGSESIIARLSLSAAWDATIEQGLLPSSTLTFPPDGAYRLALRATRGTAPAGSTRSPVRCAIASRFRRVALGTKFLPAFAGPDAVLFAIVVVCGRRHEHLDDNAIADALNVNAVMTNLDLRGNR